MDKNSSIQNEKYHCKYHHKPQTHTCKECGDPLCNLCAMMTGKHNNIYCPDCYEKSKNEGWRQLVAFLCIFNGFSFLFSLDNLIIFLWISGFIDFFIIFCFLLEYLSSKQIINKKRNLILQYQEKHEYSEDGIDNTNFDDDLIIKNEIENLDDIFKNWHYDSKKE